jgi:hypothetical protein
MPNKPMKHEFSNAFLPNEPKQLAIAYWTLAIVMKILRFLAESADLGVAELRPPIRLLRELTRINAILRLSIQLSKRRQFVTLCVPIF